MRRLSRPYSDQLRFLQYHMPHLLWLACGGKEGLTTDKLEILRGRSVSLYPDHGSAALWTERARELSDIVHLRMNDMMERVGRDGEDIGDYLVRESDANARAEMRGNT